MRKFAPLAALGGPFSRLSERWAAVTRHRRLRFAVLACLLVMFSLVVALVFAVRTIDHRTTSSLEGATEHSRAADQLAEAADLLRQDEAGIDIDVGALARLHDDLVGHARSSDDHGAIDIDELTRGLDDLARIIDADQASGSAITLVLGTAARLDRLSVAFDAQAESQMAAALDGLAWWFSRMELVAVVSAAVFLVSVIGAILPLIRSIERSLAKLQTWRERSTRDADRRTLAAQVSDGLDVAESEDEAYVVIAKSLNVAAPEMKAELLLADSSNAHLRVTVEHPHHGAPGCGVVSPWSCPAVRRGSTMVFDDSRAIRSCPHLADHADRCSAVCSPLTFMGQPMGVLHATGPVGEAPPKDLVEDLTLIAGEAAARVGTLRAFAKAELQASTDVLTGLPNRRATGDRLAALSGELDGGAVALIEIDGIVVLNDHIGKAAGDRALKVAAESLQFSSREGDFVGRWAGAEFVAVFPGYSSGEARDVVERLHGDLIASFDRAELQGLDVQIGLADTGAAQTVRGLLQVANDELLENRATGVWKKRRTNVAALPRRR